MGLGTELIQIDPALWAKTRSGARAGRGFRYQDAVCAELAVKAWAAEAVWVAVVPEGVDDVTLHGHGVEIRAQIKSRHDPRGRFSISEVADYLAKMLLGLSTAEFTEIRLALVLERAVDGIVATGWSTTLGRSGQNLVEIQSALAKAYAPLNVDTIAVLDKLHIVVSSDPISEGPLIIERVAAMDPAAGRLVAQQLRAFAGQAADKNYGARSDAPASLGATDVQTLIDAVERVIDPLGRLKLADGLCEAANFHEPLNTPDFYSGVNVMPGHISAGLVFDRPAERTHILDELGENNAVLVAGPSGVGKSALTWLAAYHSRHAVRWYRVRRLAEEDVPRLVQLAKILDARPERPVGFVIDDVGRAGTAGWDMLVFETKATSGLLAIGSIREEDVFLVGSFATTPIIRPRLDEPLAERLWTALSRQGGITFSHWVEPFEKSQGLLLEYTHILTRGDRLERTLGEQVRRRLAENRDDELELLRRIAFPARYGATVDSRATRANLGWEAARMARSVLRLIEEHAVKEAFGSLGGLHEIRSSYLDEAIRTCLDVPIEVAITDAVDLIHPATLPTFIVRVLRDYPSEGSCIVRALGARINQGDLAAIAPALHGLGLATADLIAARWLEISRDLEIEDRFSSFFFTMTSTGSFEGDLPIFEKIRQAGAAFNKVAVNDLRVDLIEQFFELDKWEDSAFDIQTLHHLQAALMPLLGCPHPPKLWMPLDRDMSTAQLLPFLELVRTTGDINPIAAAQLVNAAGGSMSLLARLPEALAWIAPPRLIEIDSEDSGARELAVVAHIQFISDEIQPDLNGDVVRLCELMLAAAPEARRAISDTLQPDGTPLQAGSHSINSKRIPRENLPGPARVAWHRAQTRAVNRLVGAPQETGRTASLAGLIEELAQRLDEAANLYLRMEKPKDRWRLLVDVSRMLQGFVPPPRVNEAMKHTLDPGEHAGSDHVHTFATDLQRLVTELADGGNDEQIKLRAMRVVDLVRTAQVLAAPNLWRMIASPPIEAMTQLAVRLQDVRAVLGHIANNLHRRAAWATLFSKTSRRHSALSRAGNEARAQATLDLAARCRIYETAFGDAGLVVHVYARPFEKDEGYAWPHVLFACLIEAQSIVAWLTETERFNAVYATFADTPQMNFAPLIRGQVAPIAIVRIGESILPNSSFETEWSAHIPYPIAQVPLLERFTNAIADIAVVSRMLQDRAAKLNSIETTHAEAYLQRINDAVTWFGETTKTQPSLGLAIVNELIVLAVDRLQAEAQATSTKEPLALELERVNKGEISELASQILGLRIALIEDALGLEPWSENSSVL